VVTSWFNLIWPLETNEEQEAKTNHISPVVHTAHISGLWQSAGSEDKQALLQVSHYGRACCLARCLMSHILPGHS